jgi:hypothetical protein
MLNKIAVLWILFAALMGFFAGASFDSAFFPPIQEKYSDQAKEGAPKRETLEERQEATNEALANYTKWLMRYTGLLFAATFAMGIATIGLYSSGQDQINLSRQEFISNQRPKLRVRNVMVHHPNWIGRPRFQIFHQGAPIHGQFFISNIGGTPATITECFCMIFTTTSGLPMRRPYEGENGNTVAAPARLEPGQSAVALFNSDPLGPIAGDVTAFRDNHRLYVLGWVEYRDDMKVRRRTAFCRLWRHPKGEEEGVRSDPRFFPVETEPDYEHEE